LLKRLVIEGKNWMETRRRSSVLDINRLPQAFLRVPGCVSNVFVKTVLTLQDSPVGIVTVVDGMSDSVVSSGILALVCKVFTIKI
jgi:sulfur transfer protein SufE